ncbi:helix-turn-helix domain-containing protein [Streptomyces sp. XM4011]|uniref:helix-turn-helix domain-containing protein n=1 Tax=Streptomyces sp. XM4011 TaxID=2929780 RepID=UPI001FF71BCD|nr:helix-turn-helix transcriptional regulator [Streptomyces sp. XM4011]MCK1817393.1 helix-turn-helix domain-containing protein [Streptomyces sp. XM4011]
MPRPPRRLPAHTLRRRLAVGRLIREARLHANLSQEELAERANLDRKTVSRIEGGVMSPRVDSLLDIADALGVSPRDLLPERLDPPPTG